MTTRLFTLRPSCGIAKLTYSGRECGLDRLGIRRRELIFEWESTLRPGGESLGINELLQLID